MDIEKLYQDVWARVFADRCKSAPYSQAAVVADAAAAAAVKHFNFTTAHEVIAAKGHG